MPTSIDSILTNLESLRVDPKKADALFSQGIFRNLIHRDYLSGLVRRRLAPQWKPAAQPYVFLGDAQYTCLSRAELKAFVQESRVGLPDYYKGVDCDDFSWRLKAFATEHAHNAGKRWSYALGVIWRTTPDYARTGHAYNWAVTNDEKFLLIEPQNGRIREFDARLDRNIDLVCC